MARKINTARIKDVVVRVENNAMFPLQVYEYYRLKELMRKFRKQKR